MPVGCLLDHPLSMSLSYFAGISIDGPWLPLLSWASTGFLRSTSKDMPDLSDSSFKTRLIPMWAQVPAGSSRYMHHLHALFISSPYNMRNIEERYIKLGHVSLLKALRSGADSSARAAHRSATASKQAMLCMSKSTAQTSPKSLFFQQCWCFLNLTLLPCGCLVIKH